MKVQSKMMVENYKRFSSFIQVKTSKMSVDRLCANKNCNQVGKHLCGGCGEEIYCSKECQKAHWATHKAACKSAVKPEAMALLNSFDSLSIKQLKNLMKAKAASFEGKKRQIVLSKLENIVEKPNLVNFVKEYVELSEVESLLSSPPPTASSSSSSGNAGKPSSNSGNSSSSSATKRRGGIEKNNHMPMLTPAQLRQQASMMRQQPNLVRKANPMFANMTDAQIREYADQIEKVTAFSWFSETIP
jgi:hypothetical protein